MSTAVAPIEERAAAYEAAVRAKLTIQDRVRATDKVKRMNKIVCWFDSQNDTFAIRWSARVNGKTYAVNGQHFDVDKVSEAINVGAANEIFGEGT